MNEKTKALGICIGASSISVVQVEDCRSHDAKGFSTLPDGGVHIIGTAIYSHEGNPRKTIQSILSSLNLSQFDRIAATGRRFRHFVNLVTLSEPEAVEYAYPFVKPVGIDCPAVVSAGGETFMVYVMNRQGRISTVLTGNKCASGTGEFFMQQLRRMNVSLEDAARWSATEEPYGVSGRCSVFCKSDCTHAINKGVPKSRVTAGLCGMMAGKIIELLKKVDKRNIMVVGGSSQNHMMIQYLKDAIPGLVVPEQAPYFEALGAALWALENEISANAPALDVINAQVSSFETLPALAKFQDQVVFNQIVKGTPRANDTCILGLDVGSTTTKAVLLNHEDNAILASVYLLTDGDPVGAARKCYTEIFRQVKKAVDPAEITITGLGVCGSGRQIAGLHALTDGIINEIIAHAAAAVHFDPGVDTLFEIGGQDAKYTYITSGVPSDYAMNEACSAGTGSFLAESAYETLGVELEDIADEALSGKKPPNFNDQCAAFISSDIKTAIHEGIDRNDVVAGLVYSICMNYIQRVKGNRPVGEKVFMQGGVCYNRAVPLAMAAISGKKIIVPPEPGLMGAYGAALEIKKRITLGLMGKKTFDLDQLAHRTVSYGKSFICAGGKDRCDRRCEINMIELEGRQYPFGGACNRYYNLRYDLKYDISSLNLVRAGEKLLFEEFVPPLPTENPVSPRRTVGLNKSFLVNSFYPFFAAFFDGIGFRVLMPDTPSREGIDQRNAAFCYPAELAHGFFYTLINRNPPPDFIFLPHLRSIPVKNGDPMAQTCPFVQGEPFYLKASFKDSIQKLKEDHGVSVLTPLLDLAMGLSRAKAPMVETAMQMGVSRKIAEAAFEQALQQQDDYTEKKKAIGRLMLAELATEPDRIAVVVFGRSYNAMVKEAHMGIPHKFASRGVLVIPYDFLPFDDEPSKRHMYWGTGQMILKAARLVEKHPQLYATYITNFSCGPDSFLIGYFRTIMGRKPSLTLELDSHTADAGIETRIEAFLDIVSEYRQVIETHPVVKQSAPFVPAKISMNNSYPKITTSDGKSLALTDPRVTLLIPSMGWIATQSLAAVFRGAGFNVASHPPSDEAILKIGRAHTSCKECLPLILTTGTMLNYVYHHQQPDEVLAYFMPSASGPCRFGQYGVFMEDLIKRLELRDVAIVSLTSDDTYASMGSGFSNRKAWCSIVLSDIMEDLRAMLLANAVSPEEAMPVFNNALQNLLKVLSKCSVDDLMKQLAYELKQLQRIPVKRPPGEVPRILMTGEMFVRRDSLSRQKLTRKLAEMGFAVACSPVTEWIRYSDYMLSRDGHWQNMSIAEKIKFFFRQKFMNRYEDQMTSIFSDIGLLPLKPIHLQSIINTAKPYISENLSGEAILTIGSAISEVATNVCGVIAIGPFGCMPNRMSEAILIEIMNRENKLNSAPSETKLEKILAGMDDLPFLAIESDGSPFPQVIQAKLEAFCQSAQRLHQRMREHG
ncbi:MAG: activase [Desulfobacteraceae bacterium]|nr:MAG: activase [Desulfobacteraceae bacterium]